MEEKMKKIILFTLLIVLGFGYICAETEDEPKTILGPHIRHGFVFAPEFKWTRIDGEDEVLVGGKIAWVVNRQFVLGFAGYTQADWRHWQNNDCWWNEYDEEWHNDHDMKPALAYGGLVLGFNALPKLPFDLYTGVLIGGGYTQNSIQWNQNNHHNHFGRGDFFWVVEPEIQFMLKFSRFMRIGLGMSYRLVTGLEADWISNKKMSGAAAVFSFNLGRF